MESPDPLKNMSNVGKSRRRISILKAPRTSVDFADPELLESPVEVAMPVEKRNSRRVSFAPATDVLLFSKENRNGSPVRKPLQDISAAINPDNRNPIGVIEKGKQPIADMENLLYAPLQTSQQRKEVSVVTHDAEDLYGEKTMMFSAHDADFDVTHSHTVVITNDSDLPYQDGEMLPTCANMDFLMSMDRKKAEPCILPKISSSSVRHFDPEFEKLLASFSKPSLPKDNSVLHKVEQNVPLTISQTAAIESKSLHAVTRMTKQQGMSRFPITDLFKNSEDFELDMDFTTCQTRVIEAKDLNLGKPSYTVTAGGSVRVMADHQRDNALNLVKMATDNFELVNMEMTQSQTAASVSLHGVEPLQMSHDILKPSTEWNNPSEDNDMEFTTCATRVFEMKDFNVPAKRGCMAFKSLAFAATCGKVDVVAENGYCEDKIQTNTETDLEMEFTSCQTRLIETKHLTFVKPSLKISSGKCFPTLDSNAHLQISMNAVENSEGSQNVANIFPEANKENDGHTLSFSCDVTGSREGFERYNCESDDMEMTSQTVAIYAKNLNPVKTLGNRRKSLAFAATCGKVDDVAENGYCEDKIQTNTETDSEMEFTSCQTRLIETKHLNFVKPSLIFPEANQENDRQTLCSEDVELTRSTGISNTLFHRGRKSRALFEEKSPGMHVNVFNMSSSESGNPDEIVIGGSHSVAIQSKDVHCPDDSSQNDSKVTGPPEGLSPNHSESRENLSDHLKNRSHGLTAFGGMKLAQNGTIPNYTSTFSRSMFSLDGKVTKVSDLNDQLDASQNDVKSTPLSVNKNSPGNANAFGASPESATMQKNDGSDLSQENCSLSCGLESAPCITAAVDGVDDASSTKSRRMSLADLRFKIRRMSCLLNEPTERISVDVCDAPLSQPKSASDGISDKTPLTALQHNPETQTTDNADYTQSEQSAEEQQPCVTAPLKLNRRSLLSRLILPKRPRSSCRMPGREHDYEVATHQVSSGMSDNIVDEVLPYISSEEDTSMVNENPQSTNEDGSSLHGRHLKGTSEEVVWELSTGHPSDSQCERTSPVDGEDMMAAEKRRRISSESNIETPNQSPEKGKCIGTLPLSPAVMAKAKDVSNRSTSQLRSETTFESTLKQSLFESQLEGHMDYTNDFQKNVADESITVSEFFQLLNIDFVIHNPRQSILPGKLASHLGHTPENLLKNRHIHHPKQMVYEAEHKNLAEKVERLKARMKDQARLLHTVNQPLWEELKCFSEDELKIFGSKMKERSYFFRKRSKAQSHEMKEALYSNLLQANLEERQRLQGKTEEADGMLKSLDDCIQELETELAAVEENGSGGSKLTLKSGQLGLEKVTIEIADKERQMCEMEVQKKCNVDQVKRLQVEIQDLNGHFTLLQGLNEWKLAERRADCDVYSFLYGSLLLEVVFDTGAGKDTDERNILDINFKLELDEEKSECHARLVHTLVSDFINGQSHWVGKYLSSRCVPKLLHDVALVVSRLRLLGEEVRRLRTWGCVKFNISDIRCVGKRVHIVFSSLEAMVEFELSLAVTMAYPCSPLQLQDFKNHIGSTSVCRLEEIVSSVSPDKNYLTRIVMAIHAAVHS
ncbi:uncharacterized protein knl1 isoform X2 [Gadus macrocephalus]|uniref:uncharacterized protein knl1 isoform X2 n=1 Tax=Gadus macrocephalus TaxID=80720 RepID=UPI0028CB2818|nr:uncharacterized protein knl1 isoform X2 [Gadus macrocephalus]